MATACRYQAGPQLCSRAAPVEQLKGLIRAGYVYRNGEEHLLTSQGREALAQPGVYPGEEPPGIEIVGALGHPGE
jgi:hypothetical protein